MKLSRIAGLTNLVLAAVLMLAVWLLIVYVASRPALRTLIDLTPQSVNTVDVATEELLKELRDQQIEVEFHLFFPRISGQGRSPAQQQQIEIIRRLRELTKLLVRRYQWLGGESVKIHEYDMYSNVEKTNEAAQAFEYKGPSDEIVVTVKQPGRERRFRKLSLTQDLATIELPGQRSPMPGGRSAVPVLKQYLGEVQLSSAIKSLLVQGTPVVYFLNSYSHDLDFTNESIGRAYGGLVAALQRLGFEVQVLNLQRQGVVPKNAALVFVPEPRAEFSERDALALYEYVRNGGGLFVNYSWSPQDWNRPVGKLGELLGFEVGKLRVHHLIRGAANRTGGRGLDGDPAVGKLELLANPTHSVTRNLAARALEVANARQLEFTSAPDGVLREPLLQTGENAWLAKIVDGYPDLRAPRGIGLNSYFVGASFVVDPPAAAEGENSATDTRKGRVVVVTGEFCNNIGLPRFGDLAFNICNWLAEREVMLDIQSNKYQPRQMEVSLPQVERTADFLFYWLPLAFFVGGLIVIFVRKRI